MTEVPPHVEAVITVGEHQSGRVSVWKVICTCKGGELAQTGSKVGATKVAITHAEEIHDRQVQIRIPE